MKPQSSTSLMVLSALLCAAPAAASNFTVNPMQVVLSPSARSAVVTIRNTSSDELRFQITAFAWDQDERGAMKLDADGARGLVVFPQLLTLPPGAEKQIRVGTDKAATDAEISYRIFFEELPASTAKPGNGVQIRTRVGLPVFVRPAGALSAAVQITGFGAASSQLSLTVRNSGKAHVEVEKVRVTGTDASGKVIYTREAPGWYVLSNRSTAFDFPIAGAECQAQSFTAELVVGGKTIKDQFAGAVPGCR
jgi:fimbrial chaperone protein